MESLDLSDAKVRGITKITKTTLSRMYLRGADVRTYVELRCCKISDLLVIDSSYFYSNGNLQPGAKNSGIHIIESEISTFRMINSTCELELNLENVNIKTIDIRDTKFYLCPSFSRKNFEGDSNEVTLPKRSDFSFKKLEEQYSIWHKNDKNLKRQYLSVMENQYRRFREIYNLTKVSNMYAEQSDYYFLMQKTLETTDRWNVWERVLSCRSSDFI